MKIQFSEQTLDTWGRRRWTETPHAKRRSTQPRLHLDLHLRSHIKTLCTLAPHVTECVSACKTKTHKMLSRVTPKSFLWLTLGLILQESGGNLLLPWHGSEWKLSEGEEAENKNNRMVSYLTNVDLPAPPLQGPSTCWWRWRFGGVCTACAHSFMCHLVFNHQQSWNERLDIHCCFTFLCAFGICRF